jgi:hypothetical protein
MYVGRPGREHAVEFVRGRPPSRWDAFPAQTDAVVATAVLGGIDPLTLGDHCGMTATSGRLLPLLPCPGTPRLDGPGARRPARGLGPDHPPRRRAAARTGSPRRLAHGPGGRRSPARRPAPPCHRCCSTTTTTAIAIAIAVGSRTVARASVTGIDETAVPAVVKLEQVLPRHLRRIQPRAALVPGAWDRGRGDSGWSSGSAAATVGPARSTPASCIASTLALSSSGSWGGWVASRSRAPNRARPLGTRHETYRRSHGPSGAAPGQCAGISAPRTCAYFSRPRRSHQRG